MVCREEQLSAFGTIGSNEALFAQAFFKIQKSGIVTSVSDGDQVVVFNPANGKALSTEYTGFYNKGTDVTLTNGKLSGYTKADIWTVGVNADGSYTFSTADGKKLSMDEKYSSTPWTRPTPAGASSPPPRKIASISRTWAAAAIWSGMPKRTTGVPSAPSAATRLCLPSSSIW
ncbi:MAG: hypothetical protein ACLR5H_11715 [Oscillospiraceae bacterium]